MKESGAPPSDKSLGFMFVYSKACLPSILPVGRLLASSLLLLAAFLRLAFEALGVV